MKEPCLCGALDCVACHGESARYYGWCDECEFADGSYDGVECTAAPGSNECKRKELADEAKAEAQLARMERRECGDE